LNIKLHFSAFREEIRPNHFLTVSAGTGGVENEKGWVRFGLLVVRLG
jgi:hypothetical protein